MLVIGINAYHGDASACILRDGALVAAAEEERFRRIKHWAGFPAEAVRYCLKEAGATLGEVSHVAINRDPRANIFKKLGYTIAKRPDFSFLASRIRNARKWASVEEELKRAFPSDGFKGEVHHIEHHVAHLASSFLVSPFDEAAVLSIDGFGDFASAAWGAGRGTDITIDNRVYFPHSLGMFYLAITQYLGFPNYGDEYKVMGLAPYGASTALDRLSRMIEIAFDGSFRLNLEFFRHHREKIDHEWDNCAPARETLFTPALEELLGPSRKPGEPLTQLHKDIARSAQALYERAFFHIANRLYEKHGLTNLALSGGCAMNSVANGKIYRNTPFKKVYIQSAAGDAGGAIGAAFTVWHRVSKEKRSFVMDHAFWGPQYSTGEIKALLDSRGSELRAQECRVELIEDEGRLCGYSARAISEGKVAGWFQGRMEWGPRALGARSILGDPRRADMKDILNLKIKRRESFRPFAPSILRESVPEWFETDDDVPFMMKVFQIREARRGLIPAVTHVDGSGRLQTVEERTNPRYFRLIKAFASITGVPIVLNTSFNENEPVVCAPREALDCFLRTKMDLLVLGDFMVKREA